ncbi:MAG: potassium-transporting ATPase subunit KdpC [Candidatus Eiseniibacteriota bacterium]
MSELRRGILYTVVTMLLFGGAYHLFVWGVGRVVFPRQSEGSLLQRANGTIVGSSLLAQAFTRPEYFHPRPSGVDYNAASTGGTNYCPSNPDHLAAVAGRLAAIDSLEGVSPERVPSEMVTASGAGLDPHIPPDGAEIQVARVARARGMNPDRVRELVRAHTESPWLGIFGKARVNVLELNLALDANGRRTP